MRSFRQLNAFLYAHEWVKEMIDGEIHNFCCEECFEGWFESYHDEEIKKYAKQNNQRRTADE